METAENDIYPWPAMTLKFDQGYQYDIVIEELSSNMGPMFIDVASL